MGSPKILHAGCGQTKIPGSIGLDIVDIKDTVDIVHDLNEFPYPFENDYFDEIHLYHVLEHLDNPIKVVEEMHRILKNSGSFFLRVPHYSSMGAFSDITHKRPFGYSSFDCFEETNPYHFYTEVDYEIVKKKIKYLAHYPNDGIYDQYLYENTCPLIFRPAVLALNFLISLSPMFFERFWCYLVGGATEIDVVLMKHT